MKGDVKIGPDYLTRCRLCLSQESAKIDIFHEEGSKRDIFQKILNCLSLIVSQDDYLPKSVCHECVNLLDNFQEFRDSCHESENILNAYISSTEGQQNFEKLPEIPDTSYHREPENDAWKVRISPCPSSKEKSLIYETDPLGKVKSSDNECSGTGELEESWAGDFNTRNEQTVDSPSISASAMIEVSEQISMQQSEDNVYDSDHDNMGDLDSDEDIQIIEEYSDDNARQSSQDNVRSTVDVRKKNVSISKGNTEGSKEKEECRYQVSVAEGSNEADAQNSATRVPEHWTAFPSNKKIGLIVDNKFLHMEIVETKQTESFDLNSSEWKDNIQVVFTCNVCDDVFLFVQDLKKHIKTHKVASKFVHQKSHEVASEFMHQKTHKAANEFIHEKTHKGASEFMHKKTHKAASKFMRQKTHKAVSDFVCEICGKKFTKRHGVYLHARVHQENQFGCPQCRRKFLTKDHLKDHIRIHTGEMPYQCPVCCRKFRHRQALRRHLKTIHPVEFEDYPNWKPDSILSQKREVNM